MFKLHYVLIGFAFFAVAGGGITYANLDKPEQTKPVVLAQSSSDTYFCMIRKVSSYGKDLLEYDNLAQDVAETAYRTCGGDAAVWEMASPEQRRNIVAGAVAGARLGIVR